ncbi:hypothetical protein C2857_007395 [Epichloe festucae Fl1]|uniref:Meiotic recombination protein DMC1 n=1 Tax=Epichloe festucae (strain Fl1) TaxID=877507 RepID=A0A7S9PUZ8_EPIFF|nr:hypothetical protein C2857_007395 [Epichloe festucae Fl1]
MDENSQEPGGFLPQTGLPSPAPSSTSSRAASALPHPRAHSLRPGSSKEDLVRRFVEEKLLNISRRYVKKFGNPASGDTVTGFKSMGEVCRELEGVVNVLWKSGTPSLQIPFLLKVASDFTQYVRSFSPSPRATFELLRRLDHCFASLLCGQDIDSKEYLPGFENGLRAGMTTTDMVRCRSLVEQTRILMVEILSSADVEEEEEGEEGDSTDVGEDSAAEELGWDIDEERLHMDAARIYENTVVQLGERLGDPLGNENRVDNSIVCTK